MLRIITILILSCGLCAAAPSLVVVPPNGHVTLSWNYDTNELSTNLWFNIYETTNITASLTNWNCITNVVGTNLSVMIDVQRGLNFFVATASNFWGETSITSNMTFTPALPIPINDSLRIEKSQ
jgi:hypothetical protein